MRKTVYLLLIGLTSLSMANAQSLSQEVIASSGTTISGSSNTLSFNAGEAVIGDISNSESLGQGFWLGAIEGVILSNEDFTLEVQTTVYPNPENLTEQGARSNSDYLAKKASDLQIIQIETNNR